MANGCGSAEWRARELCSSVCVVRRMVFRDCCVGDCAKVAVYAVYCLLVFHVVKRLGYGRVTALLDPMASLRALVLASCLALTRGAVLHFRAGVLPFRTGILQSHAGAAYSMTSSLSAVDVLHGHSIVTAEASDEKRLFLPLTASCIGTTATSSSGWAALVGAVRCGGADAVTGFAAARADISAVASSGKIQLNSEKDTKPATASILLQRGHDMNLTKQPRAAGPLMMAGGEEPEESGNELQKLYLKAAPFIYYGAYTLFFGKMIVVLFERATG